MVASSKPVLVSNFQQDAKEQTACRINNHSWGKSRALSTPDKNDGCGSRERWDSRQL